MRRVLYIVAVLLVSLLLVGGMLVAVLMSPRVETAAVRLVTAELSRNLGTKIQVGSVEYQFPARLTLSDVLVEDQQPYVLFMDEPEVSLHIEWQKRLIDLITELNPNVQVILTTHSPAVIMNGWVDNVTEVSDITIPTP